MINLKNATCLSNESVVYSISGQTEPGKGGWERLANHRRLYSESNVFGFKRESWIGAEFAGRLSFDAKEEIQLDVIDPASSTLLPDAAKKATKAIQIVLNEMKSFGMV